MLRTIDIELAGIPIRVLRASEQLCVFLDAYRSGRTPELEIALSNELISEEMARSDGLFGADQVEGLALLRAVSEVLPFHGACLVHGSAIAVDGRGYILMAPSGTGKSTQAGLWRKGLGKSHEVFMVNDDKPFVRIVDGQTRVYGSPWDGKEHLSTNTSVPLESMAVLERADEPGVSELKHDFLLGELLESVYRPQDPKALRATIALLLELASRVRIQRYGATMETESALTGFEGMRGKEREHMRLKPDFITYQTEDETIVVPTGTGKGSFNGLMRLNETAAFVLSCLEDDISEDEIVERMLAEYDASPAEVRAGVAEVLASLDSVGALEGYTSKKN